MGKPYQLMQPIYEYAGMCLLIRTTVRTCWYRNLLIPQTSVILPQTIKIYQIRTCIIVVRASKNLEILVRWESKIFPLSTSLNIYIVNIIHHIFNYMLKSYLCGNPVNSLPSIGNLCSKIILIGLFLCVTLAIKVPHIHPPWMV